MMNNVSVSKISLALMKRYPIERIGANAWAFRILHEYSPLLRDAALRFLNTGEMELNPVAGGLSLEDVRGLACCDYLQGLELLSAYEKCPDEGKKLIIMSAPRR